MNYVDGPVLYAMISTTIDQVGTTADYDVLRKGITIRRVISRKDGVYLLFDAVVGRIKIDGLYVVRTSRLLNSNGKISQKSLLQLPPILDTMKICAKDAYILSCYSVNLPKDLQIEGL